jgi:hypothetical protein
MSNIIQETYRRALECALDALVQPLRDAQVYLADDHHDDHAIGALLDIDERFADMQAALRLFRNSRRAA